MIRKLQQLNSGFWGPKSSESAHKHQTGAKFPKVHTAKYRTYEYAQVFVVTCYLHLCLSLHVVFATCVESSLDTTEICVELLSTVDQTMSHSNLSK